MTPLRQRMLDAMLLRGLAVRTVEACIYAMVGLAKHNRRSPDTLSADEVQQYMVHLYRRRKLSFSTVNQAASAFKFFYGTVLGLEPDSFRHPVAAGCPGHGDQGARTCGGGGQCGTAFTATHRDGLKARPWPPRWPRCCGTSALNCCASGTRRAAA